MRINLLAVAAKEQMITLQDGYVAEVFFDMIYKRWVFNLYKDNDLVYAGITLEPDTAGLLNISLYGLGMLDMADDKEEYEPYSELGSRLALAEITK